MRIILHQPLCMDTLVWSRRVYALLSLLCFSGRPISPPRPSVLPFNDTGLVSLALPWQYYSNRSIAISRVVVQYREVLSPGHFGPYRQIHGSIEQEKVDLVDATPNTRYEIVTIAVNEDGSSVPSHPTYSLTPDVCKELIGSRIL